MRNARTEFERQLDRETEARIARMEEPDYPFPRRFSRRDWLLWVLVTGGSLAMLILGARL